MRHFIGGAVDMFYRYGFFSLSVRVVPRDDPGKWLVREPTANIFDQQSLVIENKAGPNTFARQPVQVSFLYRLQGVPTCSSIPKLAEPHPTLAKPFTKVLLSIAEFNRHC